MTTSELRQRPQPQEELPTGNLGGLSGAEDVVADKYHPSGKVSHGWWIQALRVVALAVYFTAGCCSIVLTQLIGAPLYFINRDLYDSYMALTKQSFGLMITTMTHWWGPTTIRISGDASVADQIRQTPDGLVEFSFPERLVMVANHQIYTDWLYLWWVGYANRPHAHGYLYIILKESLKYIPVMGQGMMFYGFIFMSRKMSVDRPRMAHRLARLKTRHTSPRDGGKYLNPMWLLLFPEGTNASGNGRVKSARWADKIGVTDPQHVLLPRSTGMYFCLTELKGTVDWVYDCTVAYEGIPRGKFGEEYFSLSSTYFQGRPPKSVNFYWRRFRVDDIPLQDAEAFEVWLRERWYEKDALMEQYVATGRFPASPGEAVTKGKEGFVETEVRTRYPWEFLQIFTVVGAVGLVANVVLKLWARLVAVVS
ncbi:acyltransferase-domain-containing protein [Coniochaeta ligniaria NRRL 30616]|uniref:Acyltransferase-domain-containing protein n=1 Tax=Coniochaeta ligniaria NRRL 30616 TaxID=1408157 RepID=A0A1J7JJI8_9PEZI|nr:acyltransferase-domain-containing protein [Coniochaeta ligniaria NRRL 30616]